MNYISIENLTLHYGDKILFENVELYINKGDKIALVAKNGTGKTTLFKMLFGQELPNADAKFFIHQDIKVGYLPQEPQFDAEKTIKEIIFGSQTHLFNIIEQYRLASLNPENYDLDYLIQEMERLQAWDIESKISQILGKLELYDLDQKIKTLSGGQKKRVALTQLLIEEPELILMDEPTNHLDPDMIEWLENYLKRAELTLFIITHDRYFLDTVCNQIVELENGKTQKYQGNYAYYLDKKNAQIDVEKSHNEKAKNLYRRELEWMRRQPKARTTKSKSRIDRFDDVEKDAKKKFDNEQVKLETVENRLGSKILEFRNAKKNYGEKCVLDTFEYKFRKFEKVGIVGKNGVGKTTFIKLILGEEPLDKGEIVLGDTVKVGYYRQEINEYPPEKRLIEVVKDVAEFIPLKGGKTYSASQMLERFMFPSHSHYTLVKKLSGGEKRRLALILVLMKNPNFLILDEPTNDLDIITLNVLQEFIEEFEGCVLLITHDRYFMDNCVEHLFIFEGNGIIRDFNGTYTEYRLEQKSAGSKGNQPIKSEVTLKEEAPIKAAETQNVASTSKKKLSFNEAHELKKIEKELPDLEAQKQALSDKLLENLSFDEIQKISESLTSICEKIDMYTLRWLELSE
jgi:ATP-binding cassette subfamily F protein uup